MCCNFAVSDVDFHAVCEQGTKEDRSKEVVVGTGNGDLQLL